ncbi:MAG: hypothetical protein ACI3VN_08500 [Candidatus Onthomonas sp.]
MRVLIDETIYEGSAVEILDQLRALTFEPREFPSTDAYIRFLQDSIRRMTDLPCELPAGSVEQSSAALLETLERIGALGRLAA